MTSTTIEKNYTTNTIITNWLTLKTKLNNDNINLLDKKDLEKYDIVVEGM